MKKYSKILTIFVISLFLEVIVFNITSYRLLFGKYEKQEFTNLEFSGYNDENTKAYLKIDNLNKKVGTIKLELKNFEEDEVTEYRIYYSDETSDEYNSLNSKFYINDYEKSKYVPVYLSGETKGIIVEIDKKIYDNGNFDKLILNDKIPFKISLIRFLSILIILLFVYSIKNFQLFKENYSQKNFKQEMVLLSILLVFFIILSGINSYSSEEKSEGTNWTSFLNTEGGIYNKDFVNAIKSGKFYILERPNSNVLELENPYDNLTRNKFAERNKDYDWDTALYNGHEYIYFGILPVLLIFLPYNVIFHRYLKISVVVFIFSIFIFILLKEILLKFLQKYFKDIPFKNVVYFLIIFCSGTLILYANGMSRVYEVVIIMRIIFCFARYLFYN